LILNVYEGIWKYKILLVRQSFVWVCELYAWKFRNLFKLYKNLLNWIVCGVLVFIVWKLAYLKEKKLRWLKKLYVLWMKWKGENGKSGYEVELGCMKKSDKIL
jgi:hypothetical protein